MAQNLLLLFLVSLLFLTALDPAFAAAKKKKSKDDLALEKSLDPVVQELTPLSQKSNGRGLFSSEDMSKAMEIKLKLLDLIQEYPSNELLAKPVYEAGRLFRSREMYDDAYDFYNYLQTNFPNNPYALQAKVEIQRLKQQLGDTYFADTAAPAPKEPATAKP